MDFEEYQARYFADPQPIARFRLQGLHGVALYYQDYAAALEFFEQVFGPPNYLEGEDTRGWRVGDCWLSVFPSKEGNPRGIEAHILVDNLEELERLFAAFLEAGATGDAPAKNLMYEPLHIAFVHDPFGVRWLLVCAAT